MQDSYRNGWIGTILGMAFIFIIISLTVELNFLGYAIHAKGLVTLSLKVGVSLAFLASLIIWDYKSWESMVRVKAICLAILLSFVVGGWLALLTNRMGAYLRKSETTTVTLIVEAPRYSNRFGNLSEQQKGPPDRYLTTFLYNGEEVQMSLDKPMFPGLEPGDQAVRRVNYGLWGYKYILPPE